MELAIIIPLLAAAVQSGTPILYATSARSSPRNRAFSTSGSKE